MALLWEEMGSGESQLLGPVELMKLSKHLAARARMAVPLVCLWPQVQLYAAHYTYFVL